MPAAISSSIEFPLYFRKCTSLFLRSQYLNLSSQFILWTWHWQLFSQCGSKILRMTEMLSKEYHNQNHFHNDIWTNLFFSFFILLYIPTEFFCMLSICGCYNTEEAKDMKWNFQLLSQVLKFTKLWSIAIFQLSIKHNFYKWQYSY